VYVCDVVMHGYGICVFHEVIVQMGCGAAVLS